MLTLLLTGAIAAYSEPIDNRNLAVKAGNDGPTASIERRVALVIGNSAYQKSPLKNPVNDATDVAAKLRSMGFEVIERTNLKSSQIGRTLREFRARLTPGAVALFFYAGHEIKGENYLPAVDADIEGEEDVPNQSIAMRQIMDVMEDAKTRLNLAFLDACRNNPYNRGFRSAGDGLARISAPSGTLISFATRPGSVAADGSGRNGLYTTHLLTAMEAPNLPVELMLKKVTTGVKVASRGMQEPWMEGSIEGDFYFRLASSPQPYSSSSDSAIQRDAVDRAVEDAVRRANEQAAKERAVLQASMQRLVEEALARQNAMIERQGGKKQDSTPPPTATIAAVNTTTLASSRPRLPPSASDKSPQPGDEWEYLVRDEFFGKSQTLLWRVKGIDPSSGVLEELLVNDRPVIDWVFNGAPVMLATPTDAKFVFGPHWNGKDLPELNAYGSGECIARYNCKLDAKVIGKERISVPAGTFDAIRIEGKIVMKLSAIPFSGSVSIWYSQDDRRLLRQNVVVRAQGNGVLVNETLELQSVRMPRS